MFKKILVPLDGSPLAEQALPPALALARAVQGEVLLLRSIHPVYTMAPVVASEYEWIWPEYAREDSRREVREYLGRLSRAYAEPDIHFQELAREGEAAGVIVDTAEEESVDLIVMSTHGEAGITRWPFGNVTERVLHNAPCPVFLVRSKEPITRILIPLDGSKLAEGALEPALELARRLEARVTLLRVNEPVGGRGEKRLPGQGREPERMEQVRHSSEDYLHDVMHRFELESERTQTAVVDGPPVERILDFARLYGVNLIAMSTHGRTGLRRWLYGSVTAKVMKGADCSMLIVRPSADELSD